MFLHGGRVKAVSLALVKLMLIGSGDSALKKLGFCRCRRNGNLLCRGDFVCGLKSNALLRPEIIMTVSLQIQEAVLSLQRCVCHCGDISQVVAAADLLFATPLLYVATNVCRGEKRALCIDQMLSLTPSNCRQLRHDCGKQTAGKL